MDGFGFECQTCGEYHVGIPSFGWDYPLEYLAVPAEERAARVELGPDHCVIDDQWFFVRGCLEIPVRGHDEPLSWGVWLSLSRSSFLEYAALHDDPQREAGARFFGWLCSAVPGYPDTQSLKTMVQVRPWPLRPYVELEPTDHPLAVEQRDGISAERVREITQRVLHPPR